MIQISQNTQNGDYFSHKEIVVIGSSGFIGKKLCLRLSTLKAKFISISSSDIDLTSEDSSSKIKSLLHSDTILIILASIPPDKSRDFSTFKKNLDMANNICNAILNTQIHHLLYLSSDAVYSRSFNKISAETPTSPDDLYGIMHRTREVLFAEAAKNTKYTVIRSTMVIGSGDTHDAYGPNRFVREAIHSKKITLMGNGEDTKDFIPINNLIELIIICIKKSLVGNFLAASGNSYSFKQIADIISSSIEMQICIENLPRTQQLSLRSFDLSDTPKDFRIYQSYDINSFIRGMINGDY